MHAYAQGQVLCALLSNSNGKSSFITLEKNRIHIFSSMLIVRNFTQTDIPNNKHQLCLKRQNRSEILKSEKKNSSPKSDNNASATFESSEAINRLVLKIPTVFSMGIFPD